MPQKSQITEFLLYNFARFLFFRKKGCDRLDILGYKIDKEIIDTQTASAKNLCGTPIEFSDTPEALEIIRHSCAHLMAQAIKELHEDAQFFVGPVVNEGFYYDIRTKNRITEDELPKIEEKMRELAERKLDITRYEISKDEAIKKFKDDDLKQEVLKNIPDSVVSIYKQGNFEDLCRGPHVPNTRYLKHFMLTKVAGAYLGGKEGNEMLTRIYGIAFATKEALKNYKNMIEEAKKRDHRRLGAELGLFMFDETIGPGLPLWLPKGARLRAKLEKILYNTMRKRGYEPVRGPEILKSDAWKISGHYDNYKENMYFTKIEDDNAEYGIKPMNCPGHIRIFQHGLKSYRDLPIKYFEFGVVHRHEKSGVLHGLLRVREFTQDDAHIFCTPSQAKDVILEVIDLISRIMKKFDFSYEMELSTRPDKAIGDDSDWEMAEKIIKETLESSGLNYGIDEGGGAFYGPKIDFKITDSLGRKWQCGTIQIDLNLPKRFNLEYMDEHNNRVRPIMIHRAAFGSFERFIGILTEHCAGEFPFFIAPTQVIFIPIKTEHTPYAKELAEILFDMEIDSEIYDYNESLNKRIRDAEKERVPMIVVLGEKEVANKTVALRDRRAREQKELTKDEFICLLKEKNGEVVF